MSHQNIAVQLFNLLNYFLQIQLTVADIGVNKKIIIGVWNTICSNETGGQDINYPR